MARRVCIITGAGRGIGRATAIELARRGFVCTLVARSADALDEVATAVHDTANEIQTDDAQERSARALPIVADVTDPVAVARVVETTLARFGRIDAIVNNAGLAPAKSIEELDLATWHAVIDTNLSSAFYLAKAAWAALKASRGAIVNLGSEATRDPFPGFLAYASAKAGVNSLTQVLHREGKPLGIRAYCIAPAAVETTMFRALVSPDQYATELTLSPEDVARSIAACIAGDLQFASGETIYLHK